MLGTYSDLNLPTAPCPERKNSTEDCVYNYRTEEIYLHGNTFSGSGTNGDASDPENREIGVLLKMIYKLTPIDNMLYGGIGESSFSASSAAGNSNDNHFCIAESTRIADFGCGPGLYTTRLARKQAQVTGVDFSKRSIN